jgi:hypothetical protein
VAKRDIADYPEIQQILARIRGGKPHELVVIFIPSHDRKNKEIPDQPMWAQAALDLFGRLFSGATAFKFLDGIYQPEGLAPLYDTPIMIQSLTETRNLENEAKLFELSDFCHRMGEKTNQASIGLVVNNFFIDIQIVSK